jgi:hypothetical protein
MIEAVTDEHSRIRRVDSHAFWIEESGIRPNAIAKSANTVASNRRNGDCRGCDFSDTMIESVGYVDII